MILPVATPKSKCRCSDCVLRPESSHGILAIGRYSAPARLSRRGGKITTETVSYWFPFDMSDPMSGGSGIDTPIIENASGVRYIENF